ncbi:MAG: septum formation initiator family protein [Actinomycetota bacterium]
MIHRPGRRPRGAPRGGRAATRRFSGREAATRGSAARPPRQRRTTGALVGRTTRPAGRRTGAMTTRAAVLAVIVCALVLALTYPIRAYVGQRGGIRKLEAERTAAGLRVAALERERAQWDDPAYVEAQARERLRYVKPGEKSLVVVDPVPSAATAHPVPTDSRAAASDDPWYQRLWSTVEIAGTRPPVAPVTRHLPAKTTVPAPPE